MLGKCKGASRALSCDNGRTRRGTYGNEGVSFIFICTTVFSSCIVTRKMNTVACVTRLNEFLRPHDSRGVKIFRQSFLLEDLEMNSSTCSFRT